jgi:hypothetical protein
MLAPYLQVMVFLLSFLKYSKILDLEIRIFSSSMGIVTTSGNAFIDTRALWE